MLFSYEYPHMAVTVDTVVFDGGDEPLVLLIKRANAPFQGRWALPGGYVDLGETVLAAAHRELKEETGLEGIDLIFLGYFDAVDRDPRERTLSLAFWGCVGSAAKAGKAGDDAIDLFWFPVRDLPELAFDHALVLSQALNAWQAAS